MYSFFLSVCVYVLSESFDFIIPPLCYMYTRMRRSVCDIYCVCVVVAVAVVDVVDVVVGETVFVLFSFQFDSKIQSEKTEMKAVTMEYDSQNNWNILHGKSCHHFRVATSTEIITATKYYTVHIIFSCINRNTYLISHYKWWKKRTCKRTKTQTAKKYSLMNYHGWL